jgi:NAD(P)-dependent dehydrogenase (short-subunit alcohol dehydrogenase family)
MSNKVIVVVGASGGIGSAISHKLAKTGANLVLVHLSIRREYNER